MKIEVTVLMSVFNGEQTVSKAIKSILDQSFDNFEFIIINDGSNDNTSKIVREHVTNDSRIILIEQKNIGLTKSLNKGIQLARGKYIARQDADDISKPDRLEKQLAVFQQRTNIALVGGNSEDHFDNLGIISEWGYHPDEVLSEVVYRETPFPHSSVMIATEVVRELGGYDESFSTSQDADLWMRIASKHPISMCPEKLIERHIHPNSISSKKHFRQCMDSFKARRTCGKISLPLSTFILLRQLAIGLLPQSTLLALKKWKKSAQINLR